MPTSLDLIFFLSIISIYGTMFFLHISSIFVNWEQTDEKKVVHTCWVMIDSKKKDSYLTKSMLTVHRHGEMK